MPIYKSSGKKDGLQKYIVSVNYTDASGKKRQMKRTAYGITSAKQLEQELQNSISKSAYDKLSFDDVYLEFIKTKKNSVRSTTYNELQGHYEHHIKQQLGDYKISKIGAKQLNTWKQSVEEKKLAFTTKMLIFRTLSSIFNFAEKNEYIQTNPMTKIDPFRNAYPEKKEMQFYTPEEFKQFIDVAYEMAVKKDNYDYYIFFMIAYYTGARRGEIMALQWADFKDNKLSITKAYNKNKEITPPKNISSIREVSLSSQLIDALQNHKKRQQQYYKNFNEDFIICGGNEHLFAITIDNINKQIAKERNVKKIRLHDFRHSHASLLINNGVSPLAVAQRLGHSTVEQTLKTYSHLFEKENDKAVDILNKF